MGIAESIVICLQCEEYIITDDVPESVRTAFADKHEGHRFKFLADWENFGDY